MKKKKEDGFYEAYFDILLFSGVSIVYGKDELPFNFEDSGMGQYFKVYLQELEKLQQVVREIKGKSQDNLKTNPENNVPAKKDERIEYFKKLCEKSRLLDVKLEELTEEMNRIIIQKQGINEKRDKLGDILYGGTEDGR